MDGCSSDLTEADGKGQERKINIGIVEESPCFHYVM